ncbi:transmembrane protein 63A [Striga asiatica]|uniref:Transmembrane protein 63A n=1 Tax=Striga asiatica TaxID=4170 RepID=A0A5A7QFU2_STRAF|nr:transmembrane protein 63A [Striga asiatica]
MILIVAAGVDPKQQSFLICSSWFNIVQRQHDDQSMSLETKADGINLLSRKKGLRFQSLVSTMFGACLKGSEWFVVLALPAFPEVASPHNTYKNGPHQTNIRVE